MSLRIATRFGLLIAATAAVVFVGTRAPWRADAQTTAQPRVLLLGSRLVQKSGDSARAGRSVAFSMLAVRSGVATGVAVYVRTANRAKRVTVAIYTSARGRPSRLLTSGSARRFRTGTWVRIGVKTTGLRAGHRYWLALLGTGGRLAYRDRTGSGCAGRETVNADLKRFPSAWSHGRRHASCAPSAFVTGRPAGSGGSGAGGGTGGSGRNGGNGGNGGTTTTTTTTPSSPPPTHTNCFAKPSGCGYPDPSNTGVPAGVSLTPSGSIVARSGQTISGKDVTGSIEVVGDNVTIKNTRVTNQGDSSNAIRVDSGVTGTLIEDSTLAGQATSNAIQYAVANSGSGTRGLRLQMYNCSECWSGVGTLQDSYAISDGVITGAHYEAVYLPGGTSSPTDLEHNTLLNPHDQTAGIFGDDHAWGPMHNVTINNNLVAAGGDNGAIVTGCDGDGNTNITVTNNRVSFAYNAAMPRGSSNTAATNWANNYRDDNLKTLSDTSAC